MIIVDTAFERDSRVSREDGVTLSEIAEAARDKNIFIGIALDDDIAGADGINSSIVRNYTIDYLDQEHLYKIVEAFIFPKHNQKQPILHEVYDYFRSMLPGFRWSEQRFSALYPMHPIILEVAPFVRFYVHEFALLGFAAEAGNKVMGRPAGSLIVLDEVFDSVEDQLRAMPDLHEALEAYDRLNKDLIGKLPVMKRLHAKLILKALLLLSLDGTGKTADEIRSAMLIIEEKDPQQSAKYVEDLLESFVNALPEDIQRVSEDGRDTRYAFKLTVKDDLNDTLADAIAEVPIEIVPKILRRATASGSPIARFPTATRLNRQTGWTARSRPARRAASRTPILGIGEFEDRCREPAQHRIDRLGSRSSGLPDGLAADKPSETDVPRAYWRP